MKLCRFELLDHPDEVRSGIFHDQRIYETDGRTGTEIHELSAIRLFQPLGSSPSVRLYDLYSGDQGQQELLHTYVNPTLVTGSNSDIEIPADGSGWDVEARICCTVTDRGSQIDRSEAAEFVLGFTMMLCLVSVDEMESAKSTGQPQAWARDLGIFVGPFLVTPDELGSIERIDQTTFRWKYQLKVNGEVIVDGLDQPEVGMADLIAKASGRHEVFPGELFALPPLQKPALEMSTLGRTLMAGDEVILSVEGLGDLAANFG